MTSFVIFRMGIQCYVLPLGHVERVLRMVSIVPVPEMPAWHYRSANCPLCWSALSILPKTGFRSVLTKWLNENSSLHIKVAEMGEFMKPGSVYLVPDGTHFKIMDGGRIWLSKGPPVNGHCPSASVLFESVAERFGPLAVGVILTGMGGDGSSGLKNLHDRGGRTIAQDEASSIVFGMPKEAIALGSVDEVLPLGEIAGRLAALVAACR